MKRRAHFDLLGPPTPAKEAVSPLPAAFISTSLSPRLDRNSEYEPQYQSDKFTVPRGYEPEPYYYDHSHSNSTSTSASSPPHLSRGLSGSSSHSHSNSESSYYYHREPIPEPKLEIEITQRSGDDLNLTLQKELERLRAEMQMRGNSNGRLSVMTLSPPPAYIQGMQSPSTGREKGKEKALPPLSFESSSSLV